MRIIRCDNCDSESSGTPRVSIRGVSAQSGILIPAAFQERDFCSERCFWQWVLKNGPQPKDE